MDENENLGQIKHALEYNPSELVRPEDIDSIVHYAEVAGDYAETDIAAVVRLRNGQYAALEGACDTTGWDCQSSLDVSVHPDPPSAWFNGLTKDARSLIERSQNA